jgi:hypothetical protein
MALRSFIIGNAQLANDEIPQTEGIAHTIGCVCIEFAAGILDVIFVWLYLEGRWQCIPAPYSADLLKVAPVMTSF